MYVCMYVCMYIYIYIYVYIHAHICMDGWTDGRMDGCMDGWMDGWMFTCTHTYLYVTVCPYTVVSEYAHARRSHQCKRLQASLLS